ncbi:MAG: UDP-3-O-(3-hydroxymyristoyl)glucosamine N-acyltransferase [Verrucomicrobia bacterium]|nr:UDP-3-O-(3-hydroxymyristoyl)glucosamine N-acyltransferase [Verrucomicrobiota bacterium]
MEPKKFTLAELALLTKSTLIGAPDYCIKGVDALDSACPEDASFLANPRYRSLLKETKAGVICIDRQTQPEEGKNFLVSDDPSRAFQIILEALLISPDNFSGFTGIHPTAVIHPSAKIGKDVQVGPYAVIDQSSVIGDRTKIGASVSIGSGVIIGEDCQFHPHSTVREKCTIGNRVVLQPGAVIGSCGFGFTTDAKGQHTKLEQLGTVVLEDDVEIGANTTVDRARFKMTRIAQGTKIDNLVQIGHNVHLGQHNIVVSQTGIAGSVKTGKNVVFGGQAGVVGHLEIADFVMVATRGGVSKSITQPGKYAGGPVMNLSEYNRQQVHLRKITDYVKQIDELEKRLKDLELRLNSET